MRRWPVVILLFFFSSPSVLGQYEIPPEPEAAPLGKPQKIFGDANMHKAQEELPVLSSPPDYVRPDNSPGEPLEHVGTPEVTAPGVETKDEAKEKSGEGIAAHKDGEYETKASAEEQVTNASAGTPGASEMTASSTVAASAGVETSTAAGATTTGSAAETKGEGSYESAAPAGDSKETAALGEAQKAVETTPVAETSTTAAAEASTQTATQGTIGTPKEAGYDAPEAPKAGSSAEAPKATSSEEVPKAESSGSAGDGYSAAASEGSAPSGTEAPKTDTAPSVSSSEAPSGYDQPAPAAAPQETPAPAVENMATGQKEEVVTTEAPKEEATTVGSSEAPKSSESYSAPKGSSEATTTEASTTIASSSGTDLKAAGDGYSDGTASAEAGSAPSGTKGEGAADVKPAAGGNNGYDDGKAEEIPKAEVNGSAPSGVADVKPSGSSEAAYGEPLTPAPSEETTTSAASVPSAETKSQGEEPKEDNKIAAEIPKTACKPGEEGKTSSEGQEKSKEASHEVEGSGDNSKETSSEEEAKKDKYVEPNDLNREGSGSSEVPEGSGLSAPADNSVTLAPEGTRNPPAAPTSAEIEAATLAPYPKSSEEEGSGNSIEVGDKYASKESAEGSGSKSGEEKSKSSEEGSGEEQPQKEEPSNSAEKGSSSSGSKSEGYSTDGEKHVEEPVIVNSPELPPVKPEEAMGYEGISKEDFRADIPQPKQELSQNSDVKIVEKQAQPTISSSSASPLEQNRKTWAPYRFDCETEEDDKGPLCKEWAEGGLCEQHKPTMFLFCRRTCLCTGPFARRRRHALLN